MKKYSWILVVAAVAPLFPLACGGGTTSSTSTGSGGGSGGTGPTTGTMTTAGSTSGSTSGSTTAAAGTGGAGPIDCTTVFQPGDCDTCGQANCCAEASACNDAAGCVECLPDASLCDDTNVVQHDALIACLQASCDKECFAQPMPPDATCTVPSPSPSAGACVSLTADIKCNPVTNAPCNTAAGEACDFGGAGYQCYPAPNDVKLCGACDGGSGPFCVAGDTCDNGICVKYCCDDTDCGAGKCDKTGMFPGGVGECLGGNGGTSSSSGSSSSASSSAASSSAASSSAASSSAAASGSSSSTGP